MVSDNWWVSRVDIVGVDACGYCFNTTTILQQSEMKSVASSLSLVGTILLILCQNDILFVTGEESECPSGTIDDGEGSCINPYYSSDDSSSSDEEESSSDDDYRRSGNPHAHIDMDNDPAGK